MEHEQAGVEPATRLLDRLNVHTIDGFDVRGQVLGIVAHHLKPLAFFKSATPVGDGAFRRLAQKVDLELLARVAESDCLGRDRQRSTARGIRLVSRARPRARRAARRARRRCSWAATCSTLGVRPGPRMGVILRQVYERQLDGRVTSRLKKASRRRATSSPRRAEQEYEPRACVEDRVWLWSDGVCCFGLLPTPPPSRPPGRSAASSSTRADRSRDSSRTRRSPSALAGGRHDAADARPRRSPSGPTGIRCACAGSPSASAPNTCARATAAPSAGTRRPTSRPRARPLTTRFSVVLAAAVVQLRTRRRLELHQRRDRDRRASRRERADAPLDEHAGAHARRSTMAAAPDGSTRPRLAFTFDVRFYAISPRDRDRRRCRDIRARSSWCLVRAWLSVSLSELKSKLQAPNSQRPDPNQARLEAAELVAVLRFGLGLRSGRWECWDLELGARELSAQISQIRSC